MPQSRTRSENAKTTVGLLPGPPPRIRIRVPVERIGRHLAGEHHRPRVAHVHEGGRREPVTVDHVDLGLEEGRETNSPLGASTKSVVVPARGTTPSPRVLSRRGGRGYSSFRFRAKFKFDDDAESAPEADSGEWNVSSM